jgi:hypothetical protein
MAQVNVQWPSEDEDFDATTDKSATATMEKPEETEPDSTVKPQMGGDVITPTPSAPLAAAEPTVGNQGGEESGPQSDDTNDKPAPAFQAPKTDSQSSGNPKPPAAVVSGHGRNYGRMLLDVILAVAVVGLGL